MSFNSLDPFEGLAKVIRAMRGLDTGVQYANHICNCGWHYCVYYLLYALALTANKKHHS